MSFGTLLRKLRHEKKWSQANAAEKLDISQSAYHLWETDQTKPTTTNLLKLANVFEVPFHEILGYTRIVSLPFVGFGPASHLINKDFTNNVDIIAKEILGNQDLINKLLEVQNELIKRLFKLL